MANRLRFETSPYLLQHADNPVQWHPWDETALALARDTHKPILLSIGYSACHWCHVMAHESFEDAATAALMNDLYINIKVDREERPDLDRIYQLAQQMFTGRPGGWPLTVFLTPDTHVPIFAGTYFPKTAKYGMPAFADVLERVESYYRERPDEVTRNGSTLLDRFRRIEAGSADSQTTLTADPLELARSRLGDIFDARHGGFGDAPKFPHSTYLDFLLDRWQRSRRHGDEDTGAVSMVEQTLDAMACGGLYDHLGGGFFRYCVDREWNIPHFEKMLYDNAALLGTYADAFAATGDDFYGRIASETADWLLRDMRSPDGAFYATVDADSEGEEGRYYVFDRADLEAVLGDAAGFAESVYGLTGAPNFEQRAWHLRLRSREILDRLDRDQLSLLQTARSRLLDARCQRVPPGRDEKVLVSWNGLTAAALAKAARRLDRRELLDAARTATRFIRNRLWIDGRLKATFKDGRARFDAYLDDYAFLLAAIVELLQTDFRADELEFAATLADTALDHFADPKGGFFFTADDHEPLIHRPKPLADDATPAGNAVLATSLTGLGHLLGEPRYLDAATAAVRAAWPFLQQYPDAHASFLQTLEWQIEPPELIIVRGDAATLAEWRPLFDRDANRGRLFFWIDASLDALRGLPASLPRTGPAAAYRCAGTECSAPITSPDGLRRILANG
jgi:uncharacterized protein YyaL (SSP411 family)